MTASAIITAGLGLAGNPSLDATLALGALNRALDKLYRLKFSWQRLTASVVFASGGVSNTAQWPTTFLDFYEHEDGSVGRYSDAAGGITSLRGLTYRQYINLADRLTTTGAPRRVAHDPVTGTWYVYPKTDQAYTVSIDYYQKPADIAAGDTPLWSTHASDDILVSIVKQWALEWQDDTRAPDALGALAADVGRYRRKDQAKEGIVHQSALDPRVFLPVPQGD